MKISEINRIASTINNAEDILNDLIRHAAQHGLVVNIEILTVHTPETDVKQVSVEVLARPFHIEE